MQNPEALRENPQEYWDRQTPLFEEIKKAGGISNYVNSFERKGDLFLLEDRSIRCIDERAPGGVHMAGSGILDQANAFAIIKNTNADGVFSHAGCGAADLAFEALSEGQKKELGSAENYAKWWAEYVAKELGIPYKGHLTVNPAFHIARVSYYDGTGRFDPSAWEKLPPGFVISRAYLNPQYAKKELDLSIGIASGAHGFGEERFRESPFLIIPVADTSDSLITPDMLRKEAEEVIQKHGGKAVIDPLSVDLASLLQKP